MSWDRSCGIKICDRGHQCSGSLLECSDFRVPLVIAGKHALRLRLLLLGHKPDHTRTSWAFFGLVLRAGPVAAAAGPPTGRGELLELGQRIALEGIGSRKIPACPSCHGDADRARNPYYPYLSGQLE